MAVGEAWDCAYPRDGVNGSFLCMRPATDSIHKPIAECYWVRYEGKACPAGDHHAYQTPASAIRPAIPTEAELIEHALSLGPRSSSPDVRNPVLGLPGIDELRALPAECREPLRQVLMGIRADAQVKAQVSWRKNKGPMAAYWKAVGVYAGHIARAIR